MTITSTSTNDHHSNLPALRVFASLSDDMANTTLIWDLGPIDSLKSESIRIYQILFYRNLQQELEFSEPSDEFLLLTPGKLLHGIHTGSELELQKLMTQLFIDRIGPLHSEIMDKIHSTLLQARSYWPSQQIRS